MLRVGSLVLALALFACTDDDADDTAGGAGASSASASSTGNGAATSSSGGGGAGGDVGGGGQGGGTLDIADALAALPGVEVIEEISDILGYRQFSLRIEQPADHGDPGGQTFQQPVQLLHTDVQAPFILGTTGYGLSSGFLDEPAQLLGANQLMVEHRFFDSSRPDPADWSHLTIEQSASDFHHIAELLKPIYTAAWIGTGVSKGGMTSVYHRRFFPDDVVGTIAYVAPHSMGTTDPRYLDFVEQVGGPAAASCRQALADWQVELLERREAMIARMEAQAPAATYDILGLDVAFETAVIEGPFTFWQYLTAIDCALIPPATGTDEEHWQALEAAAPTVLWSDDFVGFYEPYFWQAAVQLGYPAFEGPHITPLLQNPGIDVPATYVVPGPGKTPVFDAASMPDVSQWIATEGERLIFVYGERDPYTAGAFDPTGAVDSASFIEPAGNHGASIAGLADPDRAQALEMLEAWTGVVPQALKRTPGEPDPARMAWLRSMRRGGRGEDFALSAP